MSTYQTLGEQNTSDSGNMTAKKQVGFVLDSFWKHDAELTSLYIVAYGLVTVLALFGNLLVVVAVYNTPSMQSSVNMLIVNMSVGGILYAVFVLPTSLLQIVYYDWFLGAGMCKATAYMQGVVVTSVIYTLIAIAIDRYFAICGKLHNNLMSKQTTLLVMLVIWSLAAALMTPYALHYEAVRFADVQPPVTGCGPSDDWPNFDVYFTTVVFLANYTIPLCLITFCYASIALKVWKKDKQFGTHRHIGKESVCIGQSAENTWRVVKMMIMIVVLFAVSWLPLYTIRMIIIARSSGEKSGDQSTSVHEHAAANNTSRATTTASVGDEQSGYQSLCILNDVLIPLSQWLSSSNCCVNPWVYCFFSPKYRRAFKRIVTSRLLHRVCHAHAHGSTQFDTQCKSLQSRCTRCGALEPLRSHRCSRTDGRNRELRRCRLSYNDSQCDDGSPLHKSSVECVALRLRLSADSAQENDTERCESVDRLCPQLECNPDRTPPLSSGQLHSAEDPLS